MAVKFPFEYIGNGRLGKIFRPIAKVNLKSPTINILVDIWMIVDTGADYTILPKHFSDKLRISLDKDCFKEEIFGIGDKQRVFFYKHKVDAKIGPFQRKIPLAFFDNNEVPALLGRLGFMETFDTTFLKSHQVIFH